MMRRPPTAPSSLTLVRVLWILVRARGIDATLVGTCHAPLTVPNASSMCAEAVNYSFFVPAGFTAGLRSARLAFSRRFPGGRVVATPRPPSLTVSIPARALHNADDLDQLAVGYSFVQSDARIALMPTPCKVALKRLACARSHLACDACDDNGSCESVHRPCRSLCDDVAAFSGECALALHALGVAPNCTATRGAVNAMDSTGASLNLVGALASAPVSNQADSTHAEREFADAGTPCTMSASVPVANAIEKYDGGVCEEVIGSDGDSDGLLYVPPAEWLSTRSLAPLARPGAVQAILESAAARALEALPPWASASCQLAARRVVCATALPSAKRVPSVLNAVAAAGWLGDQEPPFEWQDLAAVPQFPDQSLCLTCVVGRGQSRWAFRECDAVVVRRFLHECSGLRTRLLDAEGKDHFAAGVGGTSTLAISDARAATIAHAARRWALPDCSRTAVPSSPFQGIPAEMINSSTISNGALPNTGWSLAVGGDEISLALSPFASTAESARYGVTGLAVELYPQTNTTDPRKTFPVLRMDIPPVAQDDPPMAELELAVPSNRLANASLSRLQEQRTAAARSLACPYGHAVPEFLSGKSERTVRWLEGTACAVLCPVPWTAPSVHRRLETEAYLVQLFTMFMYVLIFIPNMLFRRENFKASKFMYFLTMSIIVYKFVILLSRLSTVAIIFEGAALKWSHGDGISRKEWMQHQNSQYCLNNVEGATMFDWRLSGCGILYFILHSST